jgi:hypothetical protein
MSVGIIDFQNSLLLPDLTTQFQSDHELSLLTNGGLLEINNFVKQNDLIILTHLDMIAYSISNLPVETSRKIAVIINDYELFEPLERINFNTFNNIITPCNEIRSYLINRAKKQNFIGFNETKVSLAKYNINNIQKGNNIGIYNLSNESDLEFVKTQVNKYSLINTKFHVFGNVEYKPCENYINQLIPNAMWNFTDSVPMWLSDMSTIIFPNFEFIDVIPAYLCQQSEIKIICRPELTKILENYDPSNYRNINEILLSEVL